MQRVWTRSRTIFFVHVMGIKLHGLRSVCTSVWPKLPAHCVICMPKGCDIPDRLRGLLQEPAAGRTARPQATNDRLDQRLTKGQESKTQGANEFLRCLSSSSGRFSRVCAFVPGAWFRLPFCPFIGRRGSCLQSL